MMKSLAAFATFALLAASVIALPGFAPDVKASETVARAKADRLPIKADRLPIHGIARNCSGEVWPNFDNSCLRDDGFAAHVRMVSLTTWRR
jgi:hypothetical protein